MAGYIYRPTVKKYLCVSGQAYYNRNAPPLELNEQNPLCRFKAVGYSRLGGRDDKDGHVAMMFNKSEQDIKYVILYAF